MNNKSGRIMVAIRRISALPASRYDVLRIFEVSASVCGPSALENGAIHSETGVMLVFLESRCSTTFFA